jgi:hypothetical protein
MRATLDPNERYAVLTLAAAMISCPEDVEVVQSLASSSAALASFQLRYETPSGIVENDGV